MNNGMTDPLEAITFPYLVIHIFVFSDVLDFAIITFSIRAFEILGAFSFHKLDKHGEKLSLIWSLYPEETSLISSEVFSYRSSIALIEILIEGSSLILTLVKSISNDENRLKRINVQKIGSLKDLLNK